ncbi:MAG: hypothetical protein AAB116_23060 [Candidatus Poribacteria bacterium]
MATKQKAINLTIILITTISLIGCAAKTANQQTNNPLSFRRVTEEQKANADFKNYALSTNGAKITLVSHSGLVPNPKHPIETLINGNRSSDDWAEGEGWECEYSYRQNFTVRTRYGSESSSIADIIIEFPQETQISRIVVYTVDNAEYRSSSYGVSDLGVRYPVGRDAWAPFELEGYRGKYPGRIQNNKDGTINFRFKPTKTKAVKLFICDTKDSIDTARDKYTRDKKGVIRLVEIEVYGTEKANL